MCTRLVGVLNRWDTRAELEVIPFQNSAVLSRFPWIPAGAYAEALQLVGPGGRTWQAAEAIEHVLTTTTPPPEFVSAADVSAVRARRWIQRLIDEESMDAAATPVSIDS